MFLSPIGALLSIQNPETGIRSRLQAPVRGVARSSMLFAEDAQFRHVPVYRHRPESNGIAERFVRTLKAWLRPAEWQTADDLIALLPTFRQAYNDRPHQGLSIPGLSPNELANRIWLM